MRSSNTESRIARAAAVFILTLVLVAASLWAATGSALAARCEGAYSKPGKAPAAKVRAATRCLINRRRVGHGLRRLRGHERLKVAAQRHTRHMVRSNRFSHTGAGGSTPFERVKRTGYPRGSSAAVGENIAWGEGKRARPKPIVRSWMNSSGHRRIILENRFRHVGIGVRRGSPFKGGPRGGVTYTVDFGRR